MKNFGRFIDTVRFRFAGDTLKAQQLVTFARTLLGTLVNDAGFNKLQQAYRTYRFKGGIVIAVAMFAGMHEISIFVPPARAAGEPVTEMCTGFIVNVALVDEVPWTNVPEYVLYAFALEPSRDEGTYAEWIHNPIGYFWEDDEFVESRNEYGFFEKPDQDRLYANGDQMNAKDLTLRAIWENTTSTRSHGARMGHFPGGIILPDPPYTEDTPDIIIDDPQPAQLVAEQDFIYNFIKDLEYPSNPDGKELWKGGSYYNGSIDIVATDNYLMAPNTHIKQVDAESYQMEAGDVYLNGQRPWYGDVVDPVMTDVDALTKISIALLPEGSTLTYGNASNTQLWNEAITQPQNPEYDTVLYNPMEYPGVTPDPSQYLMPPGYYYVFSGSDTFTDNNYLDIGAGTIPENRDAGWYKIKLITGDPVEFPNNTSPGKKVKVQIKLLGVNHLKSEYEFFATTGESSAEFQILVNVPLEADTYGDLEGRFLQHSPDPE